MSGGGESTTSGTPVGGLLGCSIMPGNVCNNGAPTRGLRPTAHRPRPHDERAILSVAAPFEMLAPLFHRLGEAPCLRYDRSTRSPLRVGTRLDSRQRTHARECGARAARPATWRACSPTLDAYYTPPTTDAYELHRCERAARLTFPSALATPHPENNTVVARWFPAREPGRARPAERRAVVVLPQWNSDAGGPRRAVRELLARFGMIALRLSLPYHDCAHAARAHARRLHRQLERRAHAAGVPAGGARRAAGGRVARARRASSASASSAPASARACRC